MVPTPQQPYPPPLYPPPPGDSRPAPRGRVLDCVQGKIQVRARVRDKKSLLEKKQHSTDSRGHLSRQRMSVGGVQFRSVFPLGCGRVVLEARGSRQY